MVVCSSRRDDGGALKMTFEQFKTNVEHWQAEQRREQKLAEDEQPIEADNDCGGACTI